MLGREGWRQVKAARPEAAARLPAPVRTTLPALWAADRVLAAPHLEYLQTGAEEVQFSAVFRPTQALVEGPFAVASRSEATI